MNDFALATTQAAVGGSISETSSLLNIIAMAAQNPATDVAKLSALLDMQERVIAKQAEAAFNRALAALMKKLPRIKKNGTVEYPEDKNKPGGPKKKAFNFARWEDIDEIIRPLMDEEGFSLSFNSAPKQGDGGGMICTGTLLHSEGHSRSASIPLALDSSGGKNNLQGMGSTFSYGKRYTTTMLLNLVFEGEDDDGVRGGARFISQDDADDLRNLSKEAGRQEGAFLDRLFAGRVRSFDEIEQGPGYLAAKSTLEGILHQQRAKKGAA
jgi:hypothetical protein